MPAALAVLNVTPISAARTSVNFASPAFSRERVIYTCYALTVSTCAKLSNALSPAAAHREPRRTPEREKHTCCAFSEPALILAAPRPVTTGHLDQRRVLLTTERELDPCYVLLGLKVRHRPAATCSAGPRRVMQNTVASGRSPATSHTARRRVSSRSTVIFCIPTRGAPSSGRFCLLFLKTLKSCVARPDP